mgnify:CR=1 FL=1
MLLIIDNYDSFVYNIIHVLNLPESDFVVRRNDEITIDEIYDMRVSSIIISPGPMSPKEAGISNDIIKEFYDKVPILGICLGHECIGEVFGGTLIQCEEIIHGEADEIILSVSNLYEGLSDKILGARYHSLKIDETTFACNEIRVNAILNNGTIMGIEHNKYPLYGVQFHPESILTGLNGKKILDNFMKISDDFNAHCNAVSAP